MTKNLILDITIFFCRASRFGIVIFTAYILFMFVILVGQPSYFNDEYLVKLDAKEHFWNKNFQIKKKYEIKWTENTKAYSLSSIAKPSLFFTFFQVIISIGCIYMIYFKFDRIITSVRDLKTFQENNVRNFRHIGIFLIILSVVTSFHYIQFEKGIFYGFVFSGAVSFFDILAVYILAEIFKEGNKLFQENQLTV